MVTLLPVTDIADFINVSGNFVYASPPKLFKNKASNMVEKTLQMSINASKSEKLHKASKLA